MCLPLPFNGPAIHGVFRHNVRSTLTLRGGGDCWDSSGRWGSSGKWRSSAKWIDRGQKTRFRARRTRLLNSVESVHTKLIGTQSVPELSAKGKKTLRLRVAPLRVTDIRHSASGIRYFFGGFLLVAEGQRNIHWCAISHPT